MSYYSILNCSFLSLSLSLSHLSSLPQPYMYGGDDRPSRSSNVSTPPHLELFYSVLTQLPGVQSELPPGPTLLCSTPGGIHHIHPGLCCAVQSQACFSVTIN